MKIKHPHLIFNLQTGSMVCRICGGAQGVKYPVGMNIMIAIMRAFEKDHKDCAKSVSETQMNDSEKEEI